MRPARDLFEGPAPRRPAPMRPTPRPAPRPVADEREHPCAVCGQPGGFGFGVFLRRGMFGRWACFAHRDQVEAMG